MTNPTVFWAKVDKLCEKEVNSIPWEVNIDGVSLL